MRDPRGEGADVVKRGARRGRESRNEWVGGSKNTERRFRFKTREGE